MSNKHKLSIAAYIFLIACYLYGAAWFYHFSTTEWGIDWGKVATVFLVLISIRLPIMFTIEFIFELRSKENNQ